MLDHAGFAVPATREAPWNLPEPAAPAARPPASCGLASCPELFLLPGGSVALRDPDGTHLCDPHDWLTLPAGEARGLRSELARTRHLTLSHHAEGVAAFAGAAEAAFAQSVALLPAGTRLPGARHRSMRLDGPALALWTPSGVVLWRFAPAPPSLRLAVALLGQVVRPEAPPIAPLLAAAVESHAPLCVSAGLDPQALALALAALPGVFAEDHATPPGHALVPAEVAAPLRAHPGRALLFCAGIGAREVLRLRRSLASTRPSDVPGSAGCGMLIDPPAGPAELYALAWHASAEAGQTVLAAAPCWGFCHRVDATGQDEAGNAAWFGMGADLDELAELVG
jgi:hypothetical protein